MIYYVIFTNIILKLRNHNDKKNEEEAEESLEGWYGFPIVSTAILMCSPCSPLQDLSPDTPHDPVGASGQPGEAGKGHSHRYI